LEKNEKKVVGIAFLSSYRNDTTYGGEQARARTSQGRKSQGANRLGANKPGGESTTVRGRISQGANEPGGEIDVINDLTLAKCNYSLGYRDDESMLTLEIRF